MDSVFVRKLVEGKDPGRSRVLKQSHSRLRNSTWTLVWLLVLERSQWERDGREIRARKGKGVSKRCRAKGTRRA